MTMIINVINKTKKEKTNTQFVITYTKQARSKQDKARYFYEKIISLRKVHLPHLQYLRLNIAQPNFYDKLIGIFILKSSMR